MSNRYSLFNSVKGYFRILINLLGFTLSSTSKFPYTDDFLFVLVNTVKAMIENTDKSQLSELDKILNGVTSQELKLAYDFCQGRFGQAGFSYRRHPNYFYLSSLIATFPEFELSKADRDYLKGIINFDNYLLYELD